ncbi:MAG: PxKF domain-containing protein [Dehalococcoidia bacterium]|nr:PxKF domain-containing protein [Dehalococcoidia bacterium]
MHTATYSDAFHGLLAPITADGKGLFRQGSTVPVKFELLCSTGSIGNAVANLNANGSATASNGAANNGNLFRYDSTGQQYTFKLSTKSYSVGAVSLVILLDEGTSRSIAIQLVKQDPVHLQPVHEDRAGRVGGRISARPPFAIAGLRPVLASRHRFGVCGVQLVT